MVEQSIFRVQKDKNNPYIMLNKEFLNNPNLSWKAKGLLAYLLSLPDDWKVHEKEVVTHSKDGRDSYRKALKELINLGYVHRDRTKNKKGKWQVSSYCVYEVPTTDGFSGDGLSGDILSNNIKVLNIHDKSPKVIHKKKKKPTNKQLEAAADLARIEMLQGKAK
jgi:hypothetical protein